MTLHLEFLAPSRMHPNSDSITIADLANILEGKYHLLEKFTELHEPEIIEYALTCLYDDRGEKLINEFVKNKWREFILREMHGLKSKVSTEEHRTSFVQTQAYYQNVVCECKIESDDIIGDRR